MSTAVIRFNRIPQVRTLIKKRLQERLTAAMNEMREELRTALESGYLPIQSDTGALAESLYVESPGHSDYSERLNAARDNYLSGESRWADAVRELLTSEAYTDEHFRARVAREESLPGSDNAEASVATMLAWGAWWELGHENEFTQRFEQRPWMLPLCQNFFEKRFYAFFDDLLK